MQKCQPVCSQGFCNCFQMDACAKLKKKKEEEKWIFFLEIACITTLLWNVATMEYFLENMKVYIVDNLHE